MLYFDDNVLPFEGISDIGLEIVASFYNRNMKRNGGKLQAVVNMKKFNEKQRQAMVWAGYLQPLYIEFY